MKFLQNLLNAVFPQKCAGCGKNAGNKVICETCFSGIPLNTALFCGKCGARFPTSTRACHKDFPYLLGAATNYNNTTVKNLIHLLKFKYIKEAAKPLAELLVKYVESLPLALESFVVVPMPLSGRRLRKRGFNQAELIARIFAERLGLHLEPTALLRSKHAKPQSETKGLAERKENVLGCFVVENPEPIHGRNVILVDDVTTSGATFLEAAKTLKRAGAKKIVALAAARA